MTESNLCQWPTHGIFFQIYTAITLYSIYCITANQIPISSLVGFSFIVSLLFVPCKKLYNVKS